MGRIVIRTLGRIAVSKIHRREEWNLQTNGCKQRARHAGREREREREAEMWIAGCLLAKDLPKCSARK
jgi:hypothetical protein